MGIGSGIVSTADEQVIYRCWFCGGIFKSYEEYTEHFPIYHSELNHIPFPEMLIIKKRRE